MSIDPKTRTGFQNGYTGAGKRAGLRKRPEPLKIETLTRWLLTPDSKKRRWCSR